MHACTRVSVTPLTIMPTSVSSNAVRRFEEPFSRNLHTCWNRDGPQPAENRVKEQIPLAFERDLVSTSIISTIEDFSPATAAGAGTLCETFWSHEIEK